MARKLLEQGQVHPPDLLFPQGAPNGILKSASEFCLDLFLLRDKLDSMAAPASAPSLPSVPSMAVSKTTSHCSSQAPLPNVALGTFAASLKALSCGGNYTWRVPRTGQNTERPMGGGGG